jgi:formylmethanofuran dehydrogenase subunit B
MIAYCNTIGAVKTSIEETKLPFTIDFTSNPPKTNPNLFQEIESGEYDTALIMGWDALSFLPGSVARSLKQIPLTVFSTHTSLTTTHASVVFPTALTGSEADGTIFRMDGTAVSLQPFHKPPRNILTEAQLLEQISKHITKS